MRATAVLFVVLLPAVCAAQSTSDADAGAPHMVRAAGMPLNDGTLAPGMLTVRLVEGAFTRNLGGQAVTLEVEGGKVESGTTGADGRVSFGHLPIGVRVRASAMVGGERLESEFFPIPSQSGVRVLLVAGGGEAPAAQLPPGHPSVTTNTLEASLALPVAAPVPPSQGTDESAGVAVIRAVLVTATLAAFGFVLFTRRARR